jgi:SAM-dependent methyltransferase
MGNSARHDAWSSGDSYELYMGRWSRGIAARFLDLVGAEAGLDWAEIGCGTGAFTSAILQKAAPARLFAVEPSAAFLETARTAVADPRVTFAEGDAQALPLETACADVVASGLVLNFVPDRALALAEMRRVLRPGGRLAFYVWDYPGGGVGFISAFWRAAVALDPAAAELTETGRFPFCTPDGLSRLVRDAGFGRPEVVGIEAEARFVDFDDFWHPFTLGAGPAPGYCASLAEPDRARLRDRLAAEVPRGKDGSVVLPLRAWAVIASP